MGPELHPLLWRHLREHGPDHDSRRMQVRLSGGLYDALVEERAVVVEARLAAEGNRSRAARMLGIGRNTLYRKMREFRTT